MNMKQALLISFLCATLGFAQAQVRPLKNAHAHNDYEHAQPLMEALAQGFTSVEIDVFPINGEIYVAHDYPKQLDSKRTISRLYLDPLAMHMRDRTSKVYVNDTTPLYLMIDIKQAPDQAFDLLRQTFKEYAWMIRHKENGVYTKGLVRIFISGNRPTDKILQDPEAWMALDGRVDELGKGYTPDQMPVVSSSFGNVIKWDGQKPMPGKDFKQLKALATRVHAEGKRLRLWAAPDNPLSWKTQRKAGVDLINTDKLAELAAFLNN